MLIYKFLCTIESRAENYKSAAQLYGLEAQLRALLDSAENATLRSSLTTRIHALGGAFITAAQIELDINHLLSGNGGRFTLDERTN